MNIPSDLDSITHVAKTAETSTIFDDGQSTIGLKFMPQRISFNHL